MEEQKLIVEQKTKQAQMTDPNNYTSFAQVSSPISTQMDPEKCSLNESSICTNLNENDEEHLENLNDMINQMGLNNEHYKQIYTDILRNFECEQLNFNLNHTAEEIVRMEENNLELGDLMCTMLDAVCDDEPTETMSLDMKISEETNDQRILFQNKISMKSSDQNGLKGELN